jgi:hypothetical protein
VKIFIILILTLLITGCSQTPSVAPEIEREIASFDTQENPRPDHWPDGLWRNIRSGADEVGYSLTQVLFDNIDSFDQGLYDHGGIRLKARIKREAFDNQDVLNSYSVVDHFSLGVDIKNMSLQVPLFTPNLVLGFGIGVGGSLDWMNIRQVKANRYAILPRVDEEYEELSYYQLSPKDLRRLKRERRKKEKQNSKLKNNDPPPVFEPEPDGATVQPVNTYGSGTFLDPSFRPRLSRYWNQVTFPFRLPVNLKRLAKMEEGELISYNASGYVELGPNIGFTSNPLPLPGSLEVSGYYKAFVKGNFKITILKENDRFVRVKVTRSREKGHRYGVGSGAVRYELFEGFLMFEGKALEQNLLRTRMSLVPFQFEAQTSYAKSFDVGYRYDLKYPEAQEAFKKAVFGAFGDSEDLLDREDPTSSEKVVTKVFDKDAWSTSRNNLQRFNLQFFNRKVTKASQSIEAKLTLPTGQHLVFKEAKAMSKEWKLIWGRFEKLNYNYTISLDKTAYLKDGPNALQLVIEAKIEDSHTSGYEMRDYIKKVRDTLGKDDVLPDLPTHLPKHIRSRFDDDNEYIRDAAKLKKAKYRKSSFYYGFNIDQAHLELFMRTDEEKMWPILEQAFGVKAGSWQTRPKRLAYKLKHMLPRIANVPLFLANVHLRKGSDVEVASKIQERWAMLSKLYRSKPIDELFEDIEEKIQLLSDIFSYKHYGDELLKMVLITLKNTELDYFMVATNNAFGRIQQRGRVVTNPEYLLNLTDENIGFERIAGGFKSDPNILVKNLTTEVLDDGRIKINFDLDHVPRVLYFKVFRTNRLQKFVTMAEVAYKNKGRFKVGANEIILSKKSLNELEFLLGAPLKENNYYTVTLSSSMDAVSWSKVISDRFHYVIPLAPDED